MTQCTYRDQVLGWDPPWGGWVMVNLQNPPPCFGVVVEGGVPGVLWGHPPKRDQLGTHLVGFNRDPQNRGAGTPQTGTPPPPPVWDTGLQGPPGGVTPKVG